MLNQSDLRCRLQFWSLFKIKLERLGFFYDILWILSRFLARALLTNYPELGITYETAWTGTIVNPRILVVMHYIFLSEEWEMYVTWHVMIPPYDWARIYLRHRYNQTAPTYAFKISSVQEQAQPQAIEVPDWI